MGGCRWREKWERSERRGEVGVVLGSRRKWEERIIGVDD